MSSHQADTKGRSSASAAYVALEQAAAQQKAAIVLRLMENDPQGRLVLPPRDGHRADLYGLDLSPAAIRGLVGKRPRGQPPPWWEPETGSVRLAHASLRGARLFAANLQGACLEYADLAGANLRLANLRGARLLGANLEGACLSGADLSGASLIGADLSQAFLRHTQMREARLEYARLVGANLWHADLAGAQLREARLEHTSLASCNLHGTHFGGAGLQSTALRREQLGDAIAEEEEGDYRWACLVYETLRRNFESLGDRRASLWAWQKSRQMRKLHALQQGLWARYCYEQMLDLLLALRRRARRMFGVAGSIYALFAPYGMV